MSATLAITTGSRVGDVYELVSEETLVGRQDSCDLVLPSNSVSRRHARVRRCGEDFYVDDLGSRNGTFVNGQPVFTPVQLQDRDEIRLFDVTLVFRADHETLATSEVARPPATAPDESGNRTGLPGETVAEIDIDSLGFGTSYANAETKLRAVVELTRNLQLGFDLSQLTPRILDNLFRIFPQSNLGCLFHLDPKTDDLVLGAIRERRSDGDNSLTMRPLNRVVARQVISEGKAILGADPTSIDNGNAGDSVLEEPSLYYLCAPLIGPSRRKLGSLYLEADEPGTRFSEADLDVLATVAFLVSQAIEELSLHSARYHALVDAAADGVMTVNQQGTIESVNPAVERMFDYSAEELIGGSVDLLIPDLVGGGDARAGFFTGSRETTARRKDGEVVPIHVSGGEFELDGQRHFTGILHDITERKRFETKLKQLNESLENRVQQRTGHVRLLQDVAVIANEADSISSAFRAALQRICRHMNWPAGHVYLRSRENPEDFVDTGIWAIEKTHNFRRLVEVSRETVFRSGMGMVGRVIQRRQAHWDVDLKDNQKLHRREAILECGLRTFLAFPLFMGEEVVGVVEFFARRSVEPSARFLKLMNHVGTQLGRVVERRHLQEELIDAVWDQQRQIGQELHDSLGQQLTGIGMMLASVVRKLEAEQHPVAPRLAELAGMVQQSKEEARQISKGMFPVEIDAEGLRSALDELAATTRERYELECVFTFDRQMTVRDNNVATHLFRIAQEAVTNAAKHADPSRIAVSLSNEKDALVLSVDDDGQGLSHETNGRPTGLGLRIMRYRANVIGAALDILTNDMGGTRVRCVVKRKP